MKEQDWDYWLTLYVGQYCVARGLRPSTIQAYRKSLEHFKSWCLQRCGEEGLGPAEVKALDAYGYLQYLKVERGNGGSAIHRQGIVIRQFYKAMVAYGYLMPDENPMSHFHMPRTTPKKLPRYLSQDEVKALLDQPRKDTVLGLRDRALLQLLYSTGIRASECAGLCEEDVDLETGWIRVQGKGGHERTIPLTDRCKALLKLYREQRGMRLPGMAFFLSRRGKALSRNAVYERVRKYGRSAKLSKRVTPHVMRHTFATHMVQQRVNLVALRDLLGHKQITSTQIYVHVSAMELRETVRLHPIKDLTCEIEHLIPKHRLPFQDPPRRRIC